MKQSTTILSTCLTILLSSSLVSCNVTTPIKTDSDAALNGQNSIHSKPPAILGLNSAQERGVFGYDFNRDGVAD